MTKYMRTRWSSGILATLWLGCLQTGCNAASNTPPYSISFDIEHRGPPAEGMKAHLDGAPIMAQVCAWKNDKRAPAPTMDGQHWLSLVVKDPDNLAYLWQRELTSGEFMEEDQRWRGAPKYVRFAFNLRDWAPRDFRWRTGRYRVNGLAAFANVMLPVRGGVFFMNEVPAQFREPVPPQSGPPPVQPLLRGELKVNKEVFKPGEVIHLEGFVQNVSARTLMLQTRLPFLETTLVASPGEDIFPKKAPQFTPRLSDFSSIAPGERILFFRESFIAGATDSEWAPGWRFTVMPCPFVAGNPVELRFRLSSEGIFPRDRQPIDGIWTGQLESNSVSVKMEGDPGTPNATAIR